MQLVLLLLQQVILLFLRNSVNSVNNLKITCEYNNRLFMYHIYMPVEMVLLMTKNRYYRKSKTIPIAALSITKNEAPEHALSLSVIELCKYS